jgi:hypothetical protein
MKDVLRPRMRPRMLRQMFQSARLNFFELVVNDHDANIFIKRKLAAALHTLGNIESPD